MSQENNQGIRLTGDEAQDKALLLEKEVERLVGENLKKNKDNLTEDEKALLLAQGQDNSPRGFKMTLFGKEVEYTDQATAMQEVEKAILQLNNQLSMAQGQKKTKDQNEPESFDKEKMAKLIDEDVLGGLRYAMQHIPEVRALHADNAALKQALAVHQFRSNTPGFTSEPQNIAAINSILSELGLPPDRPASLEAAYSVAVNRGVIKPQARQEPRQIITPPLTGRGNGYQNSGIYNGNSSVTPQFEGMVDRLSKEQIKALIESGKFK